MPGRALSAAELSSAMREINKSHAVRWPDEENLKKLAKAVRAKESFVEMDGQSFYIRYDTHFPGAIFVRPADKDQFAPCGYFNIARLGGRA